MYVYLCIYMYIRRAFLPCMHPPPHIRVCILLLFSSYKCLSDGRSFLHKKDYIGGKETY